jgi:hypothetical protein
MRGFGGFVMFMLLFGGAGTSLLGLLDGIDEEIKDVEGEVRKVSEYWEVHGDSLINVWGSEMPEILQPLVKNNRIFWRDTLAVHVDTTLTYKQAMALSEWFEKKKGMQWVVQHHPDDTKTVLNEQAPLQEETLDDYVESLWADDEEN